MPYLILRQDQNPNSWIALPNDSLEFWKLIDGKAPASSNEPLRIELAEESKEPTDFFDFPYWIVSNTMKMALIEFGVNNIDYFPVTLFKFGNETEHSGYYLCSIAESLSCVDQEKSHFKVRLPGRQGSLRNFQIDERIVDDRLLFRLKENPQLILISVRLKEHLQNCGLKGIYYQETDKYDGNPVSSFWES